MNILFLQILGEIGVESGGCGNLSTEKMNKSDPANMRNVLIFVFLI